LRLHTNQRFSFSLRLTQINSDYWDGADLNLIVNLKLLCP